MHTKYENILECYVPKLITSSDKVNLSWNYQKWISKPKYFCKKNIELCTENLHLQFIWYLKWYTHKYKVSKHLSTISSDTQGFLQHKW